MKLAIVMALSLLALASPAQEIRAVLMGNPETRRTTLFQNPEKFAPLLIDALRDSDAGIRQLAAIGFCEMDSIVAGELGKNGVTEELRKTLFKPLAAAARDDDSRVRHEAMVALLHVLRNRDWGVHGEPWTDPKECRILSEVGDPVLPILRAALTNDDESSGIQVTAARTLTFMKGREALETILAALPKASGGLLSILAREAVRYDDPRVVPAIIDKAADTMPDHASTPGLYALSKIRDRALPYVISQVNSHSQPRVRYYLAAFLGEQAYPGAEPALLRAMDDSDEFVRSAAATALRQYPGPKSEAALKEGVSDKSEYVRESAIEALVDMKVRSAAPLIKKALDDPDLDVRRAALGFARLEGASSFPILLKKLSEEKLRDSVIEEMRALHDPVTIPTFLEIIRGDSDSGWNEAAMGLAELKVIEAIPALIAKLPAESPIYAEEALLAYGPLATDAIIAYAPKSTTDRSKVADLLGKSKDPRAFPILSDWLRGNHPWCVIDALGELRDVRAIPLLVPFLKSDEDLNSCSAAESLGRLDARDAVPDLILALKSDKEYTPTSAAGALAKIGDQRAIDPLIDFLKTEREGQWMALEYLGNFREKRVFDLLAARLQGDFPEMGASVRGLVLYGSKDAIPLLEQRLLDEELRPDERELIQKAIQDLRKK